MPKEPFRRKVVSVGEEENKLIAPGTQFIVQFLLLLISLNRRLKVLF